MFTGIIEYSGIVLSLRPSPNGASLQVEIPGLPSSIASGASIAVNGVCLTAVLCDGDRVTFDAVPETLKRTGLGVLAAGEKVNIELPVTPQSFLGGHLVQGHVDAVGRIVAKEPVGDAAGTVILRVDADAEVTDLLVEKGSVALDGVSLTVVEAGKGSFTCALIPYTLEKTTLGAKGPGATLNIEADIIGKYLKKYLADLTPSSRITEDLLTRSGLK